MGAECASDADDCKCGQCPPILSPVYDWQKRGGLLMTVIKNRHAADRDPVSQDVSVVNVCV